MRNLHRFAWFLLPGSLLLTLPSAQAQNTATPALRANSSLVLVDVVVTDHDKPVHGLDRTRFHVLEDGNEQAIFSFDEHQPAGAPPAFLASAPLPPNTYTNLPAYPESSAVNVLLLDALNTPLGDQMRVRRKMIDYLGSVKPGTTLAIFTLSTQLRIVTQFNSDPAALVSLLRKPKTNTQQSPLVQTPSSTALDNNQVNAVAGSLPATPPPVSNTGASNPGSQTGPLNAAATLQQFEADQIAGQVNARMHITLQAMRQLAGYLGGIPGRKNVIWFSGAFPLVLFPDASLPDPFANIAAYRVEVQKTTDMLTAARVAIYPVDASGLWETSEFSAANNPIIPRDLADAQAAQWSQQREQHYDNQSTMQQVADDTGGKAYVETNDLDKAVASAIENGSSYYTLAYMPKNAVLDGRYRAIKVTLDDDHNLKLAYRRGYYADAPEGSSPSGGGPNSTFAAAPDHDAPAATEILLKARVLPGADPAFQGVILPAGSAGDKTASFHGPAHRYIVDLTIDAHSLALDNLPDGSRKAAIELAMIAYDGLGHPLNDYTHAFQVGLNAAQFERILSSGISVRLPFDLPSGQVDLRIGVRDLNADRAGSLEVPLDVAN
ncbi:MAG: VWA domain-containing protein [Terracidiphilus sp.]